MEVYWLVHKMPFFRREDGNGFDKQSDGIVIIKILF